MNSSGFIVSGVICFGGPIATAGLRVVIALCTSAVLVGCTTVHLRHPDGRTASCNSMQLKGYQRDCITDFQRQGFEVVPPHGGKR